MAIPSDAAILAAINGTINPNAATLKHYPGYTWASFVKGTSSAKLEFHDGWASWTDIQAGGVGGWLAGAHTFVRTQFPGLGMAYLICTPGGIISEAQLKAAGAWVNIGGGRLRWSTPYV